MQYFPTSYRQLTSAFVLGMAVLLVGSAYGSESSDMTSDTTSDVATDVATDTTSDKTPEAKTPEFTLRPIGKVVYRGDKRFIVLDKKYEKGLLGLDRFSHVNVFWWFDKNDRPERRAVLQVHPRGNRDNPLTGVFATRSPSRPNLIGLTMCRIVAVKGNEVEVANMDAFDGTPVLDMKPFIPGYDSPDKEKASVPDWTK